MNIQDKINYVEFPCRDFEATKRFFESVFGWRFQSYGDDYMAFSNAGIEGGFYRAELCSNAEAGAALIVLFSDSLEDTESKVRDAGGTINQAIFSFPGGRRFHFKEPSGNEFAVWSDKGV